MSNTTPYTRMESRHAHGRRYPKGLVTKIYAMQQRGKTGVFANLIQARIADRSKTVVPPQRLSRSRFSQRNASVRLPRRR